MARLPNVYVIVRGEGGGSGPTPSARVLVSISVTPASPLIAVSATQQLTATGNYSDESTADITSSVAWDSSDDAKATVSTGGLATGIAGGSASITASLGVIVGTSSVVVVDYSLLDGLKIMPLGDSNTYGNPTDGGAWRAPIWINYFEAYGISPDFVGLQSAGPVDLPDKDNEGRSGYAIGPLGALPLVPDLIPLLYDYNQPDLIMLMIGSNDCGQNLDIPGAGARLANLLDITKDALPDVTVIVALIPPQSGINSRVIALNAQIPAVVAARSSWCILVDAYSPMVLDDDVQGDGIHLTVSGYEKVATAFWGGLSIYAARLSGVDAPGVSGYTPGTGQVGDSVAIAGTAFGGVTAVRFNGVSASFVVDSSIQITAVVPGGASTGTITVTGPGGTGTGPSFTVTSDADMTKLNGKTIMPLGDGITLDGEGGYRTFLWVDYIAPAMITPSFIGLVSNGPVILPDRDCEGRDGYFIGPPETLNWTDLMPIVLGFNVPDVMLLMVGSLDCDGNVDIPGAGARFAALLDAVHSSAPDCYVIAAKVPPLTDHDANVVSFNSQIDAVIAPRAAWASSVDMYAALTYTDIGVSGFFPTPAGYSKMAAVWWSGLQGYVNTLP